MTLRTIILIVFTCLLAACAFKDPDRRLADIAASVDDNPRLALTRLDSISPGSLSPADRHFYDFLRVKAADKAYIPHSSDSLILDVIEFEAGHRATGRYPEALYYGGRVYSDLGDYPTALDFFRKSLEMIPDASSHESMELKSRALSQSARLLLRMRLHDRAVPFLMEALKIDSLLDDTFRLAYDSELLGSLFLRQRNLHQADKSFSTAAHWASFLSDSDRAHMQGMMAITKLYQGDTVAAASLIEGIPNRVRDVQRNEAMIYASDIYKAAAAYDSAYAYADRLVHGTDINNRKNGYRNLFSPELADMIPDDSIKAYIRNFYHCLEEYYNDHDSQLVMLQEAMFDYRIHQRQREMAETRSRFFIGVAVTAGFIALSAMIVILYLRVRRKDLILQLRTAIHEIERMRYHMAHTDAPDGIDSCGRQGGNVMPTSDISRSSEIVDLKEHLIDQLTQLVAQTKDKELVSEAFLRSGVYEKIKEHIGQDRPISDNDGIWKDLEILTLSVSPNFNERLRLLTGKNLKLQDYHFVLLVRCGIPQSQISILMGRSKSTVSYHRKNISEMILGPEGDKSIFEKLIRLI